MFDAFGLQGDNFITANRSFYSYRRQEHLLNPKRVDEAFVLLTGAIAANTKKTIDFATIPFDFRILSVWALFPTAELNYSLQASIVSNGVEQTAFVIDKTQLPWIPPFHVLTRTHRLEITPSKAVSNLSIYLTHAKILDVEIA